MENTPMAIRGHHLLCMLGFRGYGYSDKFVRNMERVVDAIQGGPETPLELVTESDCICSACPYQRGRECTKSGEGDEHIEKKDAAVLAHIGFVPGSLATAGEVYRRIASCVSACDLERAFCSQCEWLDRGFCVQGLADLKKKILRIG